MSHNTYEFIEIEPLQIDGKDIRPEHLNAESIYYYFRKRFKDAEYVANRLDIFGVETRVTASQVEVKHDGGSLAKAPNHKVYSALIKLLVYLLTDSKSIKLYNIVYFAFLFNTQENFELISINRNKKYNGLETSIGAIVKRAVRKHHDNNTHPKLWMQIKEEFDAHPKSQLLKKFVMSKWLPVLHTLRHAMEFSKSLMGCISYLLKCFGIPENKIKSSRFNQLKSIYELMNDGHTISRLNDYARRTKIPLGVVKIHWEFKIVYRENYLFSNHPINKASLLHLINTASVLTPIKELFTIIEFDDMIDVELPISGEIDIDNPIYNEF